METPEKTGLKMESANACTKRRPAATDHGPVREKLDVVPLADVGHPMQGSCINQRELGRGRAGMSDSSRK